MKRHPRFPALVWLGLLCGLTTLASDTVADAKESLPTLEELRKTLSKVHIQFMEAPDAPFQISQDLEAFREIDPESSLQLQDIEIGPALHIQGPGLAAGVEIPTVDWEPDAVYTILILSNNPFRHVLLKDEVPPAPGIHIVNNSRHILNLEFESGAAELKIRETRFLPERALRARNQAHPLTIRIRDAVAFSGDMALVEPAQARILVLHNPMLRGSTELSYNVLNSWQTAPANGEETASGAK